MKTISDYLHYKASRKKIPLQGVFELSPVCNFSCKMCYVRRTPEQLKADGKQLYSWEQWLELGRQCADAGMLHLLLTGGEPFIYPGFRKLYEGLHKMGIVLMINTNGTMIDRETVEWLKTMAPSRVNITLYGASPDTYERICGNRDGFERTQNAIRMLKEAGIPVVINASMIPENAEDMEGIIEFGRSLNLNTRVATYMFPPARRELHDDYSRFSPSEAADMYIRKYRCMYKNDDAFCQAMEGHMSLLLQPQEDGDDEHWGSDFEQMRCRAGRSAFWVSWDGTMTACGMMPFPLVTYPFRDSFIECWNELNEKVRNAKVMEECNACPKKEMCNPCVAQLHTETGDVTKKAPYLCEVADNIYEKLKVELEAIRKESAKKND